MSHHEMAYNESYTRYDGPMSYGFGTIYRRASDGRWLACVELPRVRGGPRRRKVFSSATREDVETALFVYREAIPATPHIGRAANMEQARALGTHTEREFWAKVRACGRICEYCQQEIGLFDYHGDHKTPVSRGGSDAIDNIAVACKACNTEKGTMTADEYRAWKAA